LCYVRNNCRQLLQLNDKRATHKSSLTA
jgi:hypothetical protein